MIWLLWNIDLKYCDSSKILNFHQHSSYFEILFFDKEPKNIPHFFDYYIEYTYENVADGKEYSGKHQLQTHPFFNFSEDRYQSSKDGTIVVKNKITETMVMFLLMKEEVLQTHIGRADPVQYKMNIIRSIDNFWD